MSTELQSAKLFANYFDESAQPDVTIAAAVDGVAVNDEQSDIAALNPRTLTVITIMFYVLGVVGAIGGLFALRSIVNLEATEILLNRLASHSSEAKAAAAAVSAQVKYVWLLYYAVGFRILVGVACFFAAHMLKKRAENAHNLAILVLGMAILYNLFAFGVSYMTTSALKGIPGLAPEALEVMMAVAVGIAGVSMLIKVGIYAGISYYLSRPKIQSLFAPTSAGR